MNFMPQRSKSKDLTIKARRDTKKLDQKEDEFVSHSVEILKTLGYDYVGHIGIGSFSEVCEVRYTKHQKQYAAKIMFPGKIFIGELKLWRMLQHENLLPLIDIIKRSNITIFIMPIHRQSLIYILDEKDFLTSRKSFQLACSWLKDVLQGLEYMHFSKQLCHLDLKTDNVLITSSLIAVICDFTFISVTTKKVMMCGLNLYTRPPEACVKEACGIGGIDGMAFDVWSFGMLALDMFTNHCIEESSTAEYWEESVYPAIFWVIQEQAFCAIIDKTFPAATITWTSIMYAQNIIQGSLRYRPEQRPKVSSLMRHSLISGTHNVLLETDRLWKCTCEDHQQITRLINYLGIKCRRNIPVFDLSQDYVLHRDRIISIYKELTVITTKALIKAESEGKEKNATSQGCFKKKYRRILICCCCYWESDVE